MGSSIRCTPSVDRQCDIMPSNCPSCSKAFHFHMLIKVFPFLPPHTMSAVEMAADTVTVIQSGPDNWTSDPKGSCFTKFVMSCLKSVICDALTASCKQGSIR